ncbi:MAG: malate dehydrogenase, partial [Nitrosopumilaceae archaeon]
MAFLAAATSLDDIHLVNRHKDKALGQALDISNAIPENSPISVIGTDFSEIKNSEVVVISASTATYMTSRMEMLSDQVAMIQDIAKKIKKFVPDSKILMISNPVDVLNYIFQKETGFSRENVIGVASSLDSSRFRYLLSKELKVKSSQIKNALVLGEHGDSMVPIFSVTKCNNKPVLELLDYSQIDKITNELQGYWKILRKFKGPSIFGIAKNTVDVIRAIIKNEELSIPASVMLDGEYGFSDVCLGVPVQIGKEGLIQIKEIGLNKYEKNSLFQSAETVRSYLLKKAY